MLLSSVSHLSRAQKSDVPFLEHQEAPPERPSRRVTSLSSCCPASCTDGKTMHSSCRLIRLFGGDHFSYDFPHGGNGLFPGNFIYFLSVSRVFAFLVAEESWAMYS